MENNNSFDDFLDAQDNCPPLPAYAQVRAQRRPYPVYTQDLYQQRWDGSLRKKSPHQPSLNQQPQDRLYSQAQDELIQPHHGYWTYTPSRTEAERFPNDSKERPSSPRDGVMPPGIGPGDKELHHTTDAESSKPLSGRKILGFGRISFLCAAALAICIVVALAVSLGVVLGTRHSSISSSGSTTEKNPPVIVGDSNYTIGGYLSPQYYSTDGAFNGSGIALASQASFDNTQNHGSVVMYFQHHTGAIRWSQLMSDGSWQGGTVSETMANDAKNGTPIAAVAYTMNDTSTWHIFYIDVNNTIRERINSNTTNVWQEGPITSLNLKANDSPMVGLQACWFGSYYGDTDYIHSSSGQDPHGELITPGADNGTTRGSDSTVGMHLWYGSTDTTFEQYGWLHGEDDWTSQGTWEEKNAQAGVGCYSWGPGTVTYVFMVNLDNALEIWWKDTNSSLATSPAHPVNQWTNSSLSLPGLHPSTSLGFTDYLYAQLADNTIHGYNVSWAAENTSFVPDDEFVIPTEPGVPGTHLSVTNVPDSSGGSNLMAFYQTVGDDISSYARDLVAGPWTGGEVPIPNS